MMSLFCDSHALGIVNYLSQSTEDHSVSLVEKKRSIQAMRQLVLITHGDAVVALPQVSFQNSTLEFLSDINMNRSGPVCKLHLKSHSSAMLPLQPGPPFFLL